MPRLRLRTLMIAVAIVALLLGCGVTTARLRRLSQHYQRQVAMFAKTEAEHRRRVSLIVEYSRVNSSSRTLRSLVVQEAVANHYRALRLACERASRRPWEPAPATDCPEPTWGTDPEFGSRLLRLAAERGLKELDLGGAGLTDERLKPVAGLTRLVRLSLSSNPITDAGLVHLRGLKGLEDLAVGRTQVSDVGLAGLAGLPRLTRLEISGSRVTKSGLHRLTRAFPRAYVSHDPDL